MLIHKLQYNPWRWACGEKHNYDNKLIKDSHFWKDVTCKKCLETKKKTYNYKQAIEKKTAKAIVKRIYDIIQCEEYIDSQHEISVKMVCYCARDIKKKYNIDD